MSLIEDASLIQIPSGYKEDKLYSIKPTNGDGDFTFTRASSATRVNAEGLIEEVPYNLLEQSNDFDTTWDLSAGIDLTSGQSGYNGSNDAWLLKKNTTGARSVKQDLTRPSGQYSFSVYLKAESTDWVYIWAYDGSTAVNAYFDLNNGVVGNTSGLDSTNVVSVGDDWYRCTITFTQAITRVRIYPAYANGSLETGTDNGIYIQDAQINKGSTAKPYFPTTDRLNVPRLDYSGGASCASLLLEPQRSNLITYSSDFSNAAWTKQDATITANQAISPDGTLNADLYTTASDLYDFVRHSITYISGNSYTISVFVKQGTSSEVSLLLPSQAFGSNQSATFDVSDGTYTITSGSPSVTIEDYGNGWYRCALSAIATITATRSTGFSSVASGAVTTLYFYGAQVEVGSYPTSYIPSNSGSQTTRTADACNGAGTSATFNDSEGVLMFEGSVLDISTTNSWISISEGADYNNNQFNLRFVENSNLIQAVSRADGLGIDVILTHTLTDKTEINKIAIKYKLNDWALWVNGVEVDTETSSNAFTANSLDVLDFDRGNNTNYFYGNTKQLLYFPSALTDSELQTLTTL